MQGVADRAGVSVGLAYHHFGSKGGLIAAILSDFYDRLDEVAMARRIEGPWAERERERIRLSVEFHLKEALSTVLLGRVHRAPEVVAVEADRFRRQVEMGARNMADGQAQGAIPADRDPAPRRPRRPQRQDRRRDRRALRPGDRAEAGAQQEQQYHFRSES